MLQSHKFPRITFILMMIAISAHALTILTYHYDKQGLGVLCIVITVAAIITMALLSTTIVHKLASEITVMINKSNVTITPEDIKRLGRACVKLDKYNVLYEIDLERALVVAHVSMGMYTRMSVADNLDHSVEYHIVGTNTILVKSKDLK